ncbi:MAG: diaminopimelate decarboxylase [Ideonella sp.]
MTLPGSPYVAYRDHSLVVEDCSLDELADRHGTPLYVYSRTAMLDAASAYGRALAGRDHLICFAMKANPNLAVLQTLAEAGCGFDIVSGGELERVLAAGGDPAKVVFSGVGKTAAEMQRALEVGVLCFNVESEAELERLSQVASATGKVARISLRVNPDVDPGTHPYISTGLKDNKFGVPHERAIDTYLRAAELPGLEVVGIDCHIGSQITAAAPYLDALDRLLDLVEAVEQRGVRLDHIDLGGGLGITYSDESPPAIDVLIAQLLARIDTRGHSHRKILFEPGRSMVGNAGVLVSEVLYLKHAASQATNAEPGSDGKNFCIVDAAMNDLVRPAMYGAWMAIVECHKGAEPPIVYDVVGPVCESGDWLGRDRSLSVKAGDRVAVLSAGAYAMSMASNYNSRGRAAEVMVSGADSWLIRRRELPGELFTHDLLIPPR